MGWLYMTSLGRFESPSAYLDDQFSYERDTLRSTVLRSSLVRLRTYYAALEQLRPGADREVFAVVCLVRFNPRDREGYIFGYKDMTEHMGPCEAECPAAILDLLTPTDSQYALAWRERCRQHIAGRQAWRRPKVGETLSFAEPLRFANGAVHSRLEVVRDPCRPRALRFRPPGGGALYRIGDLSRRAFSFD